jgi:hypothetical protein
MILTRRSFIKTGLIFVPGSTLAQSVDFSGNRGGRVVGDWVRRVIKNGGAAPGTTTINAANNFINALYAAALYDKFYTLSIFASDSSTALLTPLIVGKGGDPYTTTSNFVGLTANGFTSDGTDWIHTGFNPSTVSTLTTGNGGFTSYYFTSTNTASPAIGGLDVANTQAMASNPNSAGAYFGFMYNTAGTTLSNLTLPANPTPGYYSENRVSTTDHRLYLASSTNAHAQLGATNSTAETKTPPNLVMAFNGASGVGYGPDTAVKVSFGAFHDGFTQAQSLALFNAVQKLRVQMGGGSV